MKQHVGKKIHHQPMIQMLNIRLYFYHIIMTNSNICRDWPMKKSAQTCDSHFTTSITRLLYSLMLSGGKKKCLRA